MVKEIRGRSGAGSVPVHGLAPQNLSPDKHVDVCADSDEDRGSTPLASSLRSQRSKSVSEMNPQRHYIGRTQNLNARLVEHNRGKCPHAANHRPWKIETVVAFRSEPKARDFERYLKTGSGREFARRHF